MKPTLSVIIPTHNRPVELARLVESLCEQQYKPLQIILVNDGDQDVDVALIEALRASGMETVSMRHENPSLPANRNAGLQKATGQVVCFLDDDMVPAPDLLEQLAELYERDVNGVIDGIGLPFEDPPIRWPQRIWNMAAVGQNRWKPRYTCGRYVILPKSLLKDLTPTVRFSGGAMSFRAGLAEELRFDETLTGYALGEDRELCYRIARNASLFMATRLNIPHRPGAGGRGNMDQRGEEYVQSAMSTLKKNIGWDAGNALMLLMDLLSLLMQHFVWGFLAPGKGHWAFARGMLAAFRKIMTAQVRRTLCGY